MGRTGCDHEDWGDRCNVYQYPRVSIYSVQTEGRRRTDVGCNVSSFSLSHESPSPHLLPLPPETERVQSQEYAGDKEQVGRQSDERQEPPVEPWAGSGVERVNQGVSSCEVGVGGCVGGTGEYTWE